MKNLTVRSLIAVVAGGIGTIIVVLIVARVCPEMGRLKTLNSYNFGNRLISFARGDP